jgi:transcriptional regulator with XRE-family HTH domain
MSDRDTQAGELLPTRVAADAIVPQWTIGDRIRKARREADLSQQELADAIGVGVNRLGNWEANVNKPDDVVAIAKAIARATAVRADWIAGLYPDGTGNGEALREKRGAA